jgi:uncharacterized membrane protein YeaQ/YmgE (transglycosylase-associated protein family)
MGNWIRNGLLLACVVGIIGTSMRASALERRFDRSYSTPDSASGHTILVAIKGNGNIYVTPADWALVAPVQNAMYGFLGFACLTMVIAVIRDGYTLRGWQSGRRDQ